LYLRQGPIGRASEDRLAFCLLSLIESGYPSGRSKPANGEGIYPMVKRVEPRVEPLVIKTTAEGMIDLIQESYFQDYEGAVIRIHPIQVEQAIQRLKDAREKLNDDTGTA
jgi:hypothetical protein